MMVGKSGAFISYARKDGEAFAMALRERLANEAPDLRMWQDRPEIEGGVGWWHQIEQALERVEFLVIVMTDAVLKSEITRKEWRYARQQGVCVYPVKGPGFDYADSRLTRWMKKAHIYDLDLQWETFLAHLAAGLSGDSRAVHGAGPSGWLRVASTRARPAQIAASRS
jgi:hypothetical protein